MPNKVIPFPRASAPHKDSLLLVLRRRMVIEIGGRQFQVDLLAKAQPLPGVFGARMHGEERSPDAQEIPSKRSGKARPGTKR